MSLVLCLVFLILIDLAFNTFSLFVGEEGGLVKLFGDGAFETADLCIEKQKEHIKTYWYFIVLYCWWVTSLAGIPILVKSQKEVY
jgi:hypothetical protein